MNYSNGAYNRNCYFSARSIPQISGLHTEPFFLNVYFDSKHRGVGKHTAYEMDLTFEEVFLNFFFSFSLTSSYSAITVSCLCERYHEYVLVYIKLLC